MDYVNRPVTGWRPSLIRWRPSLLGCRASVAYVSKNTPQKKNQSVVAHRSPITGNVVPYRLCLLDRKPLHFPLVESAYLDSLDLSPAL